MRKLVIKMNSKQKRRERISRKTSDENWRKFPKEFTIAENIGAKVSETAKGAQEPVITFLSIDHVDDIVRSWLVS
mgnify:CR=1 FL=1